MSRHRGPVGETPSAGRLTDTLENLREALALGRDRLPPGVQDAVHMTLERAGARRSLSADHTVVGVFGPTGSGKSSLVNALSGTDAARVAARRPTTSEPLALVWGERGSGELLDWLGVTQRVLLPEGAPLVDGRSNAAGPGGPVTGPSVEEKQRAVAPVADAPPGSSGTEASSGRRRPAGAFRSLFRRRRASSEPTPPEGTAARQPVALPPAGGGSTPDDGPSLILLDLPDFDSTAGAHREVVQRLSGQVDVLLWVVDPQKYADAALHHGFLRGLAGHGAVMLVALNQADRLDRADLAEVRSSLAGILEDGGLPGVPVLAVSARTGAGVTDLAAEVRRLAATRSAATSRLVADAERAAGTLLPFAPELSVDRPSTAVEEALAAELAAAAGVPAVVDAVRSAYRRDAHAETGWPASRWLARLRPDPLRRLNLRTQDVLPEVRRSSMTLTQPAQRARVDHALRLFGDGAAGSAGSPWDTSIRDAARGTAPDLADALDSAVTGTDLETGRRRWWGVFGALQWVALASLVAGLAWLGVLAVLGFLQLPAVDVPRVEGFPVPTLLIAGGLASAILFAVIAALLARVGAARRAQRVRRRLLGACAEVASAVVLSPVAAEVDRCNAFRAAVLAAVGGS